MKLHNKSTTCASGETGGRRHVMATHKKDIATYKRDLWTYTKETYEYTQNPRPVQAAKWVAGGRWWQSYSATHCLHLAATAPHLPPPHPLRGPAERHTKKTLCEHTKETCSNTKETHFYTHEPIPLKHIVCTDFWCNYCLHQKYLV